MNESFAEETPSVNQKKYEAAWSYVNCAREELESCQVGTDKVLYKRLENIIDELRGIELSISVHLTKD